MAISRAHGASWGSKGSKADRNDDLLSVVSAQSSPAAANCHKPDLRWAQSAGEFNPDRNWRSKPVRLTLPGKLSGLSARRWSELLQFPSTCFYSPSAP